MKSLIESIFGQYTPITYTITQKIPVLNQQLVGDGVVSYDTYDVFTDTVVASGASGVDWQYVLGVFGFFLVVYCIFRIIGTVIKNV